MVTLFIEFVKRWPFWR